MLKYAGLMALTASSTALGFYFAGAKGRRVRELSALLLLIAELETRIRFQRTELSGLLCQLSRRPELADLPFLHPRGREDAAGDIPARLSAELESAAPSMRLTREDRQLALSFFAALGTTDLPGQLENCRMHAELLGRQLEAARKDYGEKHKLYVALGLCAGLALSVLLI